MASVRGLIINLPEQQARRERLLAQLDQLGQRPSYELLEAERGAEDARERRGLGPGEDGIWRSVLKALRCDLGAAEYLHLLEDDAVLSSAFFRWLEALPVDPPEVTILFTDMYAGPSIYSNLLAVKRQALQSQQLVWLSGSAYSGCLSSWLIHRSHVDQVRRELEDYYQQAEQRIPIDNYLRRLFQQGTLKAGISMPFLTSIDLPAQRNSSIQVGESARVHATRLFGSILRRRLSVLQSPQDLEGLAELIDALMSPEQLNQWLETTTKLAKEMDLFRYRLDPRLLGEPGNPQVADQAEA